ANAASTTTALTFSALAGLLSALLYLTRFQAVLAPLAVALILLLAAPRPAVQSVVALGAATVPIAIEAFVLLRMPHASAAMLLDFASYRQIPDLPPFQFIVRPSSLVGWIVDQ